MAANSSFRLTLLDRLHAPSPSTQLDVDVTEVETNLQTRTEQPRRMLYWPAEGGSGVTTVVAAIGVQSHRPRLLVDLVGDLGVVLAMVVDLWGSAGWP